MSPEQLELNALKILKDNSKKETSSPLPTEDSLQKCEPGVSTRSTEDLKKNKNGDNDCIDPEVSLQEENAG